MKKYDASQERRDELGRHHTQKTQIQVQCQRRQSTADKDEDRRNAHAFVTQVDSLQHGTRNPHQTIVK